MIRSKIIKLILVVVIIMSIMAISKLYIFGKISNVYSIGFSELCVNSNSVSLSLISSTSAEVYKSYSYYIDNDRMYIKVKSVLVGGLTRGWDGKIRIEEDFSELKEVYLQDSENMRLIWSKKKD